MKSTRIGLSCMIGIVLCCLVEADIEKIYWVDSVTRKIERANLDGTGREVLISDNIISPEAICIDPNNGYMYWSDSGSDTIERADLDGSNREVIVSGMWSVAGLALDLAHGKMYWTDLLDEKIFMSNMDGTAIEALITTGLEQPYGIAVDAVNGKIYWADYVTDRIERSNLDGTSREVFLSTNMVTPYRVALDTSQGKLYWIDSADSTKRIERLNLDGTNRQIVISGHKGLRDLALDLEHGKIYWAQSYYNNQIARANLDGSMYESLITTDVVVPRGICLGPESVLQEPNFVPIACIVGGNRVVEAGVGCEAKVVLDGSCSSDEDSTEGTNDDINDFDWYEVIDACDANSDIWVGSGEVIECNLGLGEHLIILEVTDKAGAFDSNEVVITVVDVTPPEFSLWVEPNVLWPPNNKMVLVTPGWEVSDNCDDSPEVSLVDVTMSAEGDVNDYVQIDGDGSIYLRAQKGGGGAVRIYTLTYEAVDDSGNAAIGSATVAVPHDQR